MDILDSEKRRARNIIRNNNVHSSIEQTIKAK